MVCGSSRRVRRACCRTTAGAAGSTSAYPRAALWTARRQPGPIVCSVIPGDAIAGNRFRRLGAGVQGGGDLAGVDRSAPGADGGRSRMPALESLPGPPRATHRTGLRRGRAACLPGLRRRFPGEAGTGQRRLPGSRRARRFTGRWPDPGGGRLPAVCRSGSGVSVGCQRALAFPAGLPAAAALARAARRRCGGLRRSQPASLLRQRLANQPAVRSHGCPPGRRATARGAARLVAGRGGGRYPGSARWPTHRADGRPPEHGRLSAAGLRPSTGPLAPGAKPRA